jgi:N utilization substance protein B
MQILFRLDMNPQTPDEVFADFWCETSGNEAAKEFTEDLVRGTMEHLDEIDGIIAAHARNWDIRRIGRVDKGVMRMALYEMLYRNDIPPVVSINEAVDIAKEFGSEHSGGFVNGILDSVAKELKRPAREPGPGFTEGTGG